MKELVKKIINFLLQDVDDEIIYDENDTLDIDIIDFNYNNIED